MKLKNLTLIALTSLGAMNLSSCTDEEIAAGAIGVIIGIGIANNNDNDHHHHRPPPPPPRRECYDRWGYIVPCSRYRSQSLRALGLDGEMTASIQSQSQSHSQNLSLQSTTAQIAAIKSGSLQNQSSQAALISQKFDLNLKSSLELSKVLTSVAQGKLDQAHTAGFTDQDLTDLALMELPSDESLFVISKNIGATHSELKNSLTLMLKDLNQQAENIESPYWKSCLASGQWKTRESAFCDDQLADGCSPQTGASQCLAL